MFTPAVGSGFEDEERIPDVPTEKRDMEQREQETLTGEQEVPTGEKGAPIGYLNGDTHVVNCRFLL